MIRALIAFITFAAAASIAAGAHAELALERVVLSSGGVGYFAYGTTVDGDATLALEVPLAEVDDVLKSIVVYDDAGRAGTIALPGRQGLPQVFRDLPFGRAALASPVDLLNALQGAEIAVTGKRALAGRVLRVVPEAVAVEGGTVTRHRVSLVTASGLAQFVLEDAEAVRFVDPALAAQVTRALATIAAMRVHDRRRLEIAVPGEGRRRVRVAYVAEAPLWKASYRIVLAGDAERARVQGWAVIENMSGTDWRDIALTLVSGNPVTFRQALYTAYYVDRPEVPVEVVGRVLPPPADTGVVGRLGRKRDAAAADKAEAPREEEASSMLAQAPAAKAPLAESPMMAGIAAASSTEATTQVMFRIPHPISVAAGFSLLVPVIDQALPVRRLAVYDASVHPTHPMAALRLTNATASGLPPGVVTLYEREGGAVTYVGDARLGPLPAGEDRLLAYAVDQKTTVSRARSARRAIVGGTLSKGVFRLRRSLSQTTRYRVRAPANEPRTLVIVHPKAADWRLAEPKDAAVTDTAYRITVRLAPSEQRVVPVTLVRTVEERLAVASMAPDQALALAATGALDDRLRAAFREVAARRRAIAKAEQAVAAAGRRRDVLYREQGRLRENLVRVPRDSDLSRRYLEKLGRQETEIERIDDAAAAARSRLAEARAAFDAFVGALDLP